MRRFVIINSLSKTGARNYADKNCPRATWYDDGDSALAALRSGARPWFVAVDGSREIASGLGALAMGFGYSVETKAVP